MKAIKFLQYTLEPVQDDFVGLEDIICVNGLVGWLDFYCQKYLVVITDNRSALQDTDKGYSLVS